MKRQQEESFDVAKATPRILRNKTVGDSKRGFRVAPYQSLCKTYRDMILMALSKLPDRVGSGPEIKDILEQDFPLHLQWAKHARRKVRSVPATSWPFKMYDLSALCMLVMCN